MAAASKKLTDAYIAYQRTQSWVALAEREYYQARDNLITAREQYNRAYAELINHFVGAPINESRRVHKRIERQCLAARRSAEAGKGIPHATVKSKTVRSKSKITARRSADKSRTQKTVK